jgi:DNA-binding LacI/PurR family transcriptional regulator
MQENVLRFMTQTAHESKQLIMFDCIAADEDDVSVFIREDCVDAIVIFHDIDKRYVDMIETFGIPFVRVNTNDRTGPGCITFDEENAMKDIASHFGARGRKRAFMFHPGGYGYWCDARMNGLKDGSYEAGMLEPLILPFNRKFHDPRQFRNITDELISILTEHSNVDCAVLSSDRSAPMFYHVLDRMGKRLHYDFSVAAINASAASTVLRPQLTSLKLNDKKLGKYIVEMANAGINEEPEYENPDPVEYTLVVRESS